MSTTAELRAKISHLNDPDGLSILLPEQCHGAGLFRLFQRHLTGDYIKPFIDLLIDDTLYLRNLFFCHRRKVGKVKTKFILIYQRTRLLHMTSKNHSQRFLHKMGGAVVICRQISPALLHFQRHIFPSTKGTRYHLSHMSDLCPLQFDSILYKKPAMFCTDHAGICCLSTHRSIKGRLLHQHRSFHSL